MLTFLGLLFVYAKLKIGAVHDYTKGNLKGQFTTCSNNSSVAQHC